MTAQLRVLSAGLMASIQDSGRTGYAGFGVPRSGALDKVSLRTGNALVGNVSDEAAIEFRLLGPTLQAENGSVRIGLACHAGGERVSASNQETQKIQPWQTVLLQDGDILKVGALKEGASGYLTIAGGLALPKSLNSLSTYTRAKLGGLAGELLSRENLLPLKLPADDNQAERILTRPFRYSAQKLRVIPGPQDDYFSREVWERFLTKSYRVSAESDRMGVRLEGEPVRVIPKKGSDLISDGLVQGSIQVPGSGLPIILGADCQTVGGYPKIATVISADLHKLGQLKPGDEFQFQSVSLNEAQQALRSLERDISIAIASLCDYYGEGALDLKALYENNLVDGVVDAANPANFPGHLETDL